MQHLVRVPKRNCNSFSKTPPSEALLAENRQSLILIFLDGRGRNAPCKAPLWVYKQHRNIMEQNRKPPAAIVPALLNLLSHVILPNMQIFEKMQALWRHSHFLRWGKVVRGYWNKPIRIQWASFLIPAAQVSPKSSFNKAGFFCCVCLWNVQKHIPSEFPTSINGFRPRRSTIDQQCIQNCVQLVARGVSYCVSVKNCEWCNMEMMGILSTANVHSFDGWLKCRVFEKIFLQNFLFQNSEAESGQQVGSQRPGLFFVHFSEKGSFLFILFSDKIGAKGSRVVTFLRDNQSVGLATSFGASTSLHQSPAPCVNGNYWFPTKWRIVSDRWYHSEPRNPSTWFLFPHLSSYVIDAFVHRVCYQAD